MLDDSRCSDRPDSSAVEVVVSSASPDTAAAAASTTAVQRQLHTDNLGSQRENLLTSQIQGMLYHLLSIIDGADVYAVYSTAYTLRDECMLRYLLAAQKWMAMAYTSIHKNYGWLFFWQKNQVMSKKLSHLFRTKGKILTILSELLAFFEILQKQKNTSNLSMSNESRF